MQTSNDIHAGPFFTGDFSVSEYGEVFNDVRRWEDLDQLEKFYSEFVSDALVCKLSPEPCEVWFRRPLVGTCDIILTWELIDGEVVINSERIT